MSEPIVVRMTNISWSLLQAQARIPPSMSPIGSTMDSELIAISKENKKIDQINNEIESEMLGISKRAEAML